MRIIAGPCQHESIEQLRWLKSGCTIGTESVYFKGIEIN